VVVLLPSSSTTTRAAHMLNKWCVRLQECYTSLLSIDGVHNIETEGSTRPEPIAHATATFTVLYIVGASLFGTPFFPNYNKTFHFFNFKFDCSSYSKKIIQI